MPTFNLQLQFAESGAIVAARRLGDVSDAAGKTGESLNAASKKAEQCGQSISSAMSDAAKKVLALVSACKALNLAQRTFSMGSAYNEKIEKAQLGIASVIAATNELRNAQGKLLKGQ